MQYAWRAPGGLRYPLSGQVDLEVVAGTDGIWTPPVHILEDRVPNQPGTRLRAVRTDPREVHLPLVVHTTDWASLVAKMETIAGWFDPNAGDGQLEVTTPAGSTRLLTCRASSFNVGNGGPTWRTIVVGLHAADPWFYQANPVNQVFSLSQPASFFGTPFFPLALGADTIQTALAIDNPGAVEAWPRWTLQGPGSNPTLTNLSTGESLTVQVTLTGQQQLLIDTRPDVGTVALDDGTNVYALLTASSSLWSLRAGASSVQITMTGSDVTSSVRLTLIPRFRGV